MEILIIEDDEVWQQQLGLMLDELPELRLNFADTLQEARSAIFAHPPHLVIADIMLPDGVVFELFNADTRPYPVIFTTAFASHKLLNQALNEPNSSFIVKPFHRLTLIAAIKKLIKTQTIIPAQNSPKHLEVLGKYKQRVLLSYEVILYIEADGNYMKINTPEKVYSFKSSLKNLTEALDERFLQIHKSFIVNTTFVKRMDLTAGIVVTKGKVLPIGRAYRRQTIEQLTKIIR